MKRNSTTEVTEDTEKFLSVLSPWFLALSGYLAMTRTKDHELRTKDSN